MKGKAKRIGGYLIAGLLGAVLSSVPVRSDNPLPNGGQIPSSGGSSQFLGGICKSGLSKSPDPPFGNGQWTCSGGWFASADVSALYAVNNYTTLQQIATTLNTIASKLDTLHSDNSALSTQIQNQVAVFNKQIQKTISNQLAAIPAQLVTTKEMQQFHDQVVQDAVAQMAKQQPAK